MEINPRRYYAALVGGFLWMVLVILLYYYVHRPITPAFVGAFGGAVLDSLSTLLLVVIAGGLGQAIRQRFINVDNLSAPEQLAMDGLGGFGVMAVLILLVGAINLSFISMAGLLLVIVALTYRHSRAWLQAAWAWPRTWRFNTHWERGLAFFIGFNLVLAWLNALTPPTAFDSLTYHLVGPKLWVTEGRFISLPDNHFFAFPAIVHTLFSGQMALLFGRITAATTLQFAITILGLMAIGGFAARRFVPFTGILSTAIFLSGTSFWLLLARPYVDLVVMAFAAASFITIEQWREAETDRTKWLMLAAVFVGLTMSAKYNAVAWGLIVGLFVLNYSWRDGVGALLKNSIIYGAVAAIVLAPWLLRNLALYDNPVYPFGPTTGQWDDLSNEFYFADNSDFLATLWWVIAFIPLTSTFFGIGGADLFGGNIGFDATIGPLYVLLLPFLLWVWQTFDLAERRRLKSMTFLVSLSFVFWTAFSLRSSYGLQTRLVIYLFPPLIVMASVAFDRLRVLPEKPLNITFLVRTFIALVFVLTFIDHLVGIRPREGVSTLEGTTTYSHFLERRNLEYLAGIIDQSEYLEHNLGWYAPAIDAVNELPDDAHILFLWETRSLYCDEPRLTCEEDTIIMRWWHDRRNIGTGTAEEIVNSWQARGISHVLIWESGRDFEFERNPLFTDADRAVWEDVPPLLEVVWQGDSVYTLYQLPSR